MKWILKLRPWQLFLLVLLPPVVLQIVAAAVLIATQEPSLWLLPLFLVASSGIFVWIFAMGINLHKRLPVGISMSVSTFKLAIAFPLVYFVLLGITFAAVPGIIPQGGKPAVDVGVFVGSFAVIFLMHIASMVCMVYILYFAAKALKTVEWQKPVTFSDFAGEFFLIWFFPLGIWFLQPRINALFAEEQKVNSVQY